MSKKKRRSQPSGKRHNHPITREVNGTFSGTPAGFGFVTPDDGSSEDVFIPPKYTADAMDGDQVTVRIQEEADPFTGKGPVGRIESILERKHDFVVAELNSKHTVRPLDRKLPDEIKVNSVPKGAQIGSWVRLRMLDDGKKHTEELRGTVEDVLGKAGTVEADLNAVIAEYKLPPRYTDAQNQEAEKIVPQTIDREDLSKLFTVTIDPHDAKDFDDAVSIQEGDKSTEVLLGIHIADVAAWIRPNTKWDKEAAKRSFSSYIPGMFSPMLPKNLTAKISLREGEREPAHSVLFTLRKSDGKILKTRRLHSTIKVNKRLNFTEVQQFINDPESAPKNWTPTLKKNLQLLITITRKMRKLRKKVEEFLMLETTEIRVLCDEETKTVTGIERKVQCEADQIIEECMLAANSAVAAEVIQKKIPALFRVHPEPAPEKIEEFSMFVSGTFHRSTGDLLSSRTACNDFLEHLPDDHSKPVILSRFLRSLPRASYHNEPELHYGLGKFQYSHFTSPIRRYPDLALHQQLWANDTKSRMRTKKTLQAIAMDSSDKEENNDNAYFAANDRLKIHYLQTHTEPGNAKLYEAIINKVSSSGLVCDIAELGIYGFVPVSMIRGGGGAFHHRKNDNALRAAQGHRQYKVGDFVYLVLDSLDLVRGTAIFRIAL